LGVTKRVGIAIVAATCTAALATACSNSHPARTDIIRAGQVDIQLPPGWTVTRHGLSAPATTAPAAVVTAGGAQAAGAPTTAPTGSTIPLAKEDPTTAFFQATSDFSSCLKGLGVKFIGAPDPKNPNSPANDPGYLKNLTTCAAQSHIVQALKDFQTAQNNQTPDQIKQSNAGYLKWRDCMVGRGWQIPQPKPDAQGRLFSISGSGGGGPQLTPPPGQDIFNSSDIRECAAQAQQQTGAGG
jgi:hypothetical protein